MVNTVLLIEKDAAQREHLGSVIREKLAYDLIKMTQGREAMEYIIADKQPRPDLILFDVAEIAEPSETIANLRILTAHAPIIVLVRFGDYDRAMLSLAAGAQDFITKPASTERMGTTFRNALQLRDARRETESLRLSRMTDATEEGKAQAGSAPLPFSVLRPDGHLRSMWEIDAEIIRFAMQYYSGRMTEIARRLGIGRSTLYRKLNEMSVRQVRAA